MENHDEKQKVLYRSSTNRVIFGVCGGLGEYFEVDPILFRIVFLALIFGAGSGILLYLLLAFFLPRNPASVPHENNSAENIDVKERINELAAELRTLKGSNPNNRRHTFRIFFGLILLVVGLGILAQDLHLIPGYYFDFSSLFSYIWPVLIILIGVSILSKEAH